MSRLPTEAREGLTRAWLAILAERHPEMVWVPCEREEEAECELDPREGEHSLLAAD
jgi:hypothetical protein